MGRHRPPIVGIGAILGLFLAIYLAGIAVLTPLLDAGIDPVTEPTDPSLGILFVALLIFVSGGMLLIFKWGLGWLIRGFIIVVSVIVSLLVFDVLIPAVVTIGGVNLMALFLAILLGLALVIHPHWYVIDLAGVVLGAGAIAMFGITLGILPVLVLLVVLAVYDAISVYGTKHMLSLAEGAIESRLPVVLMVPTFRPADEIDPESTEEGGEMIMIGLGDAIVPGMLVAAAIAHGGGTAWVVGGLIVTPAAIGAIFGIAIGLLLLFTVLSQGGAHPGLPLLNSGAIGGYLVGALIDGMQVMEAIGLVALG